MTKTSRKSVSQAAPKKKPATTAKRATVKKTAAVANNKKTVARKKTTNQSKEPVKKKVGKVKRTTTTTKKSPNKAAAKKTTKAKATNKVTAKKNPTAKTTNPKRAADKQSVVLPNKMSIRAREKALVLADTFEKDFYPAGVTIAKVTGFCFLLVGALVTYTQLAQVWGQSDGCSAGACNVAQVSAALDSTQPLETKQTNYVKLLADLPTAIEEPLQIPIEFSSVEKVTAYVQHLTNSGTVQTKLPLAAIGNNKYEVAIDPEQLPNSQFELKISVLHVGMTKWKSYSLGYFSTIDVDDPVTASNAEEIQLKTATTSSTKEEDNDDESQLKTATTTTVREGAVEQEVIETTPTQQVLDPETVKIDTSPNDLQQTDQSDESLVTQGDIELDTDLETKTVDVETVQQEDVPVIEPRLTKDPLRITTNNIVAGIANVTVEHATKNAVVTFQIRPLQTLNTQFLGQLISGTRTFFFDSRQFPNGQYQLYAQERQNGVVTKSNTAQFTIQNQTTAVSLEPSSSSTPRRELFTVSDQLPADRAATTSMSEPISENITNQPNLVTPVDDIQERARAVLRADAQTLDELFQRYAVAEQSGDTALQTEAQKAIQGYRTEVISTALRSNPEGLDTAKLDTAIAIELDGLTQKVQVFETIRRERDEIDSATDSDGDGISDFDEITLYKTDPTRADTDNDGFTDGAEIINGFNPNDAAIEAAMLYESPKETPGVVKTDTLQVIEVNPEIQLSTKSTPDTVRTVVKGKGLANSFVTLYLFSSPTIVTVRTDADGSFEYTFSQELEDGQHQVYVALTDNTGSIIAQSQPFTFVKEAQAFSVVDEAEAATALTASDVSNQLSSYRTVLGMSVFALGILLVLLGIGLKTSKPEVLIVEDMPV